MMPAEYVARDGSKQSLDLDAVISFLESNVSRRKGWASLVVYYPQKDIFVELRDEPQDILGNAQSECEEISPAEIAAVYRISETACMQMRENPRGWTLVDLRKPALTARS